MERRDGRSTSEMCFRLVFRMPGPASVVTEDIGKTWVKSPVEQSSLASVLAFGLDPCPVSMVNAQKHRDNIM